MQKSWSHTQATERDQSVDDDARRHKALGARRSLRSLGPLLSGHRSHVKKGKKGGPLAGSLVSYCRFRRRSTVEGGRTKKERTAQSRSRKDVVEGTPSSTSSFEYCTLGVFGPPPSTLPKCYAATITGGLRVFRSQRRRVTVEGGRRRRAVKKPQKRKEE
jgi:hypothetical protein